jgi:tetratricopeptide (TPR) repeat protein
MSDEQELQDRFPEMRRIYAPPSLQLAAGTGTSMFGSRDYDEETDSYVSTQCICLFMVPLIALAAYRVIDARGGGHYFLGRVPLSRFSRVWNVFFVISLTSLISLGVWEHHTHTPAYIAQKKLEEGDRLAEAGNLPGAAQLYREVALSPSEHAGTGGQKLQSMMEGPAMQAPVADAAEILKVAVEMQGKPNAPGKVLERGIEISSKHADADPHGALLLLNTVAGLSKNPKDLLPTRRKLLERLVPADPQNSDLASQLAVVYESQDELDRCEKLLAPHAPRLGASEGARILGHIYASQGKFNEAHALLTPYANERLEKFQAAQTNYENALKASEQRALNGLQSGAAPGFNFNKYRSVPKDQQSAMITEYMINAIKNDPSLTPLREAVIKESNVVPVALDLGIVTLHRAQTQNDPAARKADLEQAEKTFLAVRGAVGESAQFRINLAQVYYWLGKHDEGKKLFDDVLASEKRGSDTLLHCAHILREVGINSEARKLAEEAYEKEPDQDKKYSAASMRALLRTDLDDEITWLSRANTSQPGVKASLCYSRGNKAISEGKDEEAAKQLRECVAIYAKQLDSSASLNNAALAYMSLFRVTGDRAELDRAGEMLDKAVGLEPSNALLLHNAADNILKTALRDVAGDAIDFKVLKIDGSVELLSHLYRDRASRDALRKRVRQHSGVVKARSYLDRLVVLSPKNIYSYTELSSLHGFTHDAVALRALAKRLEEVELDVADAGKRSLEYYAGKDEARYRTEAKASTARWQGIMKNLGDRKDKTFALASVRLSGALLHEYGLGLPADLNEAVRLAEQAHKAAPSRATYWGVVAALLTRATRDLAKTDKTFAAMAQKTRRSVDAAFLIPIALAKEGKTSEAVSANKDVQRVLELTLNSALEFKDEPSEWSWAMIQPVEPDEARKLAATWQADPLNRWERSINAKLAPYSATTALTVYWSHRMTGDDAKAKAALKEFAARKVPLPIE